MVDPISNHSHISAILWPPLVTTHFDIEQAVQISICQWIELSGLHPLSYTIPWRSGSYTCFSNRSEAKNMADFGLCWRQIHAIWYLRLQVITTDQAQFWSRLKFHTLLSFCRIMFCFLSFHGIKFCRFFRVFSMFVGRLTVCLGICKFYKLFWPVKGKKKPRNISAKTIFEGTIGLP